MRRADLAHLLRAATRIAGDPNILVIGSQAILGTYSEDELPQEAWLSVEADLAFVDDPASGKADQVEGAIGELSLFHETHSYYAQGVDVTTAVLPRRCACSRHRAPVARPSPAGVRRVAGTTGRVAQVATAAWGTGARRRPWHQTATTWT